MYKFGTGRVFVVPTNLPGQGIQIGTLQDIEVDVDQTIVSLYGQSKFPDAIAQGEAKITGKAKSGKFSLNLANQMLFGQTIATGYNNLIVDETSAIPGTPFQITVVNSATWVADLAVRFTLTGAPLTHIATGTPTTGQYTVTAGVYTFATADTGKSVAISYTYNVTSTGQNLAINQSLMGTQQAFAMYLKESDPTNGNTDTMILYQCVGSKLSIPYKNNNFMIQDIEWQCFANAGGQVMSWGTQEGAIGN